LRHLFDSTGIPYLTVPGNHDFARIMLEIFPEGIFVNDDIRLAAFKDYESEVHVPVRKDMAGFEALLKDKSAAVQVHLQHFLITPEIKLEYPYNYINSKEIREMMDKKTGENRKLLSLSGHYHPGTEVVKINNCSLSVVPAFFKPPHIFRIHTITDNKIETEEFTTG
jgi:hypothetical protein